MHHPGIRVRNYTVYKLDNETSHRTLVYSRLKTKDFSIASTRLVWDDQTKWRNP